MKRVLFALVCVFLFAPLAFSQVRIPGIGGVHNGAVVGGPTFNQDYGHTCSTSGTITSCSYTIFPTTAKSARYLMFGSGSNVKASSGYDCASSSPCLSSSGDLLDTYSLCPSSKCNAVNTTEGSFLDGVEVAGNTAAGATVVTINFSGSASVEPNGCQCVFSTFNEYPAPSGLTFSFDGADNAFTTSCGTSCTLANPTVSGTDVVIHTVDSQTPLTNLNTGFTLDFIGNIFNLAATTSTALTVNNSSWVTDSAISFKLSGSYTANGTPWASVTTNNAQIINQSCSPTCTITVPTTSAGLGFIAAASHTNTVGSYISSISGWTVPSGAGTCRISASGAGQLSCAYNLSLAASVTSIALTMSATDHYDFMFFNLTDSNGTPSLDAQNSTSNSASLTPSGQSLTLGGTSSLPDVVFQLMATEAASPDPNWNTFFITLYPYPGGSNGYTPGGNVGGTAVLLNTTNQAAPTWVQATSKATVVAAVAFKP
jgi:hypothetical protein